MYCTIDEYLDEVYYLEAFFVLVLVLNIAARNGKERHTNAVSTTRMYRSGFFCV